MRKFSGGPKRLPAKGRRMSFRLLKTGNSYHLAIFLSSLSLAFGILREFLLVYLLGFTSKNDLLQIYLSIFYTVGLAIDAVRLSCLNLFSILPLGYLVLAISTLALPFSIIIGLIINYSAQGIDLQLLALSIAGSYLNLIAALFITHKQRNNLFLAAQLINVLPNFILIPGVLICYWLGRHEMVKSLVILTALIPVVQCLALWLLPLTPAEKIEKKTISLYKAILICTRHFSTLAGEQLFQILTRAAFFNFGTGYLTAYALSIRIYSALRFILIDSYIGSKLATWKKEFQNRETFLFKLINSSTVAALVVAIALLISLYSSDNLNFSMAQLTLILSLGFYFSTIVRIIYFKINHLETNSHLVWRFTLYELFFAFLAFMLTIQFTYPILALVWLGYVAKPFAQLLFLRKRFSELALR